MMHVLKFASCIIRSGRCSGDFNVIKSPEDKVIKVKRGHRQVLKLRFVCEGKLPTTTVECRRNNKEEISADNDYYNITRDRPSGKNVLPLEHTITISNFSRSENITCKTSAENSPSATFVLVEDGKKIHVNCITIMCEDTTSYPGHFTSHVGENGPGLGQSHGTLNFGVFSDNLYWGN